MLAVLASPPATEALDPDLFPRRSLRHVVYAALLHFGLETAPENLRATVTYGSLLFKPPDATDPKSMR